MYRSGVATLLFPPPTPIGLDWPGRALSPSLNWRLMAVLGCLASGLPFSGAWPLDVAAVSASGEPWDLDG